MARPTKGTQKQNEVISWKCTREIKDTVTALASFRNLNVPDLLTVLVLEAMEKDRAGVEAMKKLESKIAAMQERFKQARAAVRENPAASIELTAPTTSTEPARVEDTGETTGNSGGSETSNDNDDTSEQQDDNAGKKKA